MFEQTEAITIRPSRPGDEQALVALAERDSKLAAGDADYMLAERGGALIAAVRIDTLEVIADPFTPSAALAEAARVEAARFGVGASGDRTIASGARGGVPRHRRRLAFR